MSVYVYSRSASSGSLTERSSTERSGALIQRSGAECAPLDDLAVDSERLSVQTYALEQGWVVAQSFEDADSEWATPLDQRSRGAALLASLVPGDVLLSASLGHLCGSVAQMASLLDRLEGMAVDLHVVDLGLNLISQDAKISFQEAARLFAGIESRRYAERILSVKRRQRKKGRFLGGSRPFGFSVHENGRLIENPTEQRTVEKIKALRQKGQSLRAIAAAVSTPIAPISFKTVQRVLQRLDGE